MIDIRHPDYDESAYRRYRLAHCGGDYFIDEYLEQREGENNNNWEKRKKLTFNPRIAGQALDEFTAQLTRRLCDVTRYGFDPMYSEIVNGQRGGVDGFNSSMNTYVGSKVIPELVLNGRVAVLCERMPHKGPTVADNANNIPYFCTYSAENLLSWGYVEGTAATLGAVLLREYKPVLTGGLISDIQPFYRHYALVPAGVMVTVFDAEGNPVDEPTVLDLPEIPCTILSLSRSLMDEISRYQITILNISSSTNYYAWASNVPFYTEQVSPTGSAMWREGRENSFDLPQGGMVSGGIVYDKDGNPVKHVSDLAQRKDAISVGAVHGRRYPIGTDRPDFINPSPEPMQVSMLYLEQLKKEVRQMLMLAVAAIDPRRASAESKLMDQDALEAGLSYIGSVVEAAEYSFARHWHTYYNKIDVQGVIKYPDVYNVKSDDERQAEAERLSKLRYAVPSRQYMIAVGKMIAEVMFGGKLTSQELSKIHREVEQADSLTADPDILEKDLDNHLVSTKTASAARGYPPSEYLAAKAEAEEKLKMIAMSQGMGSPGARGLPEADPDPKSGRREKMGEPGRGPDDGVSPEDDDE